MTMKIAVIGAGITGLSAAYDLAKAGHEVEIFERSETIGGLAAGFPTHGTYLEQAYHHIFTTDKDIIGLTKELGIGDTLLWCPSSIAMLTPKRNYRFTGPIDLLKFSVVSFANRIRMGIVVLYIQQAKSWTWFGNVPAHAWMRRWFGKEAYDKVWRPLLIGKFHNHYENISMAWLWSRLHTRAHSRGKGEIENERLGYYRGGFHIFIETLKNALEKMEVRITLNAAISGIRHDKVSGQNVVKLPTGDKQFDKVICTVPSYVCAALLKDDPLMTAEYLKKLTSIDYLGAICLVFSTRQGLSPYYWHNVLDPSSPFLALIQHTNLVGTELYKGEHFYYLGTYLPHDHHYFTDSNETIEREFFTHLTKLFPDFDANSMTEKHVFRFKNAQHVVSCDYEQKIPEHNTPLPGVFLSNFSQVFPEDRGTNYAVREGRRAAALCLQA